MRDDARLVVLTVNQLVATRRARAIGREVLEVDVEGPLAASAGPATGEALDEHVRRHVEVDDGANPAALRPEPVVERVGLGQRAGETIEKRAVRGIGML